MHLIFLALCCLISGNVHAQSGAPLSHVRIALLGVASLDTTSDAKGNFSLSAPQGAYVLSASVRGFSPVAIALKVDRDVTVDVALEALDSPKLRQIGTVIVDGRLAPIRGVIPSIDLTRSDFDRLGNDRLIEGLQALPSVTFSRPNGGSAAAISVLSLRGPDPSEALDTLDGQLLNDGNTGDLDLSRFPVAAFSSVDLTEGLGPEDAEGSNTFGGGINFVSLRPTQEPHYAYSVSGGSFGRSEVWFNTTGTQGRLGYGGALDDQNESGFVNQTVQLYQATPAWNDSTRRLFRLRSARRLRRTWHSPISPGRFRRTPISTLVSLCWATTATKAARSTASMVTREIQPSAFSLDPGRKRLDKRSARICSMVGSRWALVS